DNTEIDTQEIITLGGCGFGCIYGDGQKEGVVTVQQISLPAGALQRAIGITAKAERDFYPSVQRQERHPVKAWEATNPLVIDHCPGRGNRGCLALSRL